jgi:non-specific serine/threonine protein kinase
LAQGDTARAGDLLEESLTIFREIDSERGIAFALHSLGRLALATGDLVGSATHHADALALRRTLADRHGVTADLERLAVVAIAADRPEVAAHLCGAAEALRAEINVRRSPRDEETLAEVVTRARAALGGAFTRVRIEGRQEPDQAVVDALAFATELAETREPRLLAPAAAPSPATTLTRREHEVLKLLVDGQTDREIATALSISPRTVETHVAHMLGKLGLQSRTAAAAYAVREGLI